MPELHELTALEAAAAVRTGEVSPVELVEHALDRISRLDGQLGAFVTITADRALGEARAAERLVAQTADPADLPPLLGVPTAIKDLNNVAGVPIAMGSRTQLGTIADFDDTVVALLRSAGTMSLGKTATPEFGLPCYTETDIGPPTRTPWDTGRGAGGSSGGAAAAVAAGFVPIAQGSDGGGSIRIPASVCGLVGLKPSRGRVSRGPLNYDSSRLGVLGPLSRTVRDAAAFLDVVAVPQPGDPDRPPPLPPGESFLACCDRDPGRLRIGRFRDSPMDVELDEHVIAAWEATSELLAGLGHEVLDVPAPLPPEAVAAFETLWTVGAAGLVIDPERESQLRPLTRHLRAVGATVTGVEYANALGELSHYSRLGLAATADLDVLMTPTLGQLPVPVGWFDAGGDPALDFERQKQFTPFTALYNSTGQPAISLPLQISPDGLPIGMMFAGRPGGEATLLALAASLEFAAPWRARKPPIWSM